MKKKIFFLYTLFLFVNFISNSLAQELLWEQKFSSSDLYYQNIAIDSTGKIYVLTLNTLENNIFVSIDFGENWSKLELPYNDYYYRDIATDQYNHIYLSRTSNPKGVLKSTDDGATWFSLSFDRSASKLFIDTNGDIYVGSWEGVFKSTDYGEIWNLYYYHQNVTSFIDKKDSVVLIGSSGRVHYSTNNGLGWSDNGFVVGNYWPSVFCGAINDEYFYAGTDAGLFISTNFGTTWNRKLPSSDFRKLHQTMKGIFF
jgi:photosystem II stability/assembly factor-like uncharacterized protein